MGDWKYRIYEFTDPRGSSVIGRWLEAEKVTRRDRGQLVAKLDMLAMVGSLLPNLAGPIQSKRNPKMQSHVYKLVVHGDVMLRPMLCKGPIDNEGEFTLLLGAIETGDVLDHDAEEAEHNMRIVIEDPSRRVRNGRYR